MIKRHTLTALFFLIGLKIFAQNATVLDSYVKQGLADNLSVRQQQFNLQKSYTALQEARNLFLPTAELDAAYSLAAGGRKINFPVGDLLNPIYQTLNQLTQSDRFPTVANQDIQFLPNNFHDTKIRLIHPLLNMEITYNRDIRREMISMQQAEVNLYKRQLVADIKTAYFTFLKAEKAVSIYESARRVVQENVRVNEKMVQNQMATPDVVLRAKSEQAEVIFQLTQAKNSRKAAANYLNFLLNRSLETPIVADTTLNTNIITQTGGDSGKREEFEKINSALRLNALQMKLGRAYRIPKINHILDLGYQGFEYKFNADQRYIFYNIALQWNLFGGFRNQLRTRQIDMDKSLLETQKTQLDQQVKLQVENARYALDNARESLVPAQEALKNAEAYFRLLSRRYAEGQTPMIEFLDARNKLTAAQLRYTITQYDILIKAADWERVTAGYNF
jgi:outer membrane protein